MTISTNEDKKLREQIQSAIKEAMPVGSEQMLQTMHGVLSQIVQKYGGDYAKASQSPEWQVALKNGNQALSASTQKTQAAIPAPMQTTGPVQKKTIGDLRASKPSMAQQSQQAQVNQQQRSVDVASKLRAQQQQKKQMESVRLDMPGLTEVIRMTVREAINEVLAEMQAPIQAPPAPPAEMGTAPASANEALGTVEKPDENAADELLFFTINDNEIFQKGIQPAITNLKMKMAKGVYNPELATKLWTYVMTAAAQKYAKEYGDGTPWNEMFNMATRKMAAQELANHFDGQIKGVE